MNLIIKWLVTTAAIMISASLITGVSINGFWSALCLAAVLALFNVTLKPLLIILTLPINILTLGLFIFVINTLIILISSTIVKGFSVSGFWPAFVFSIAISIFSYLLNILIGKEKRLN
jgi:putative membrane protein